MKTLEIHVIYYGDINQELDDKIREVLEKSGFKWWAQGFNIKENKRDMTFDIDEKELNGSTDNL
jgi:hypothetical protein